MIRTKKTNTEENKYSRVFSFSDNNYDFLPAKNQVNFNLENSFAVECWVKFTNWNDKKTPIFAKSSRTKSGFELSRIDNGNTLGVLEKKTWFFVIENEWSHISLVCDKNDGFLYIFREGKRIMKFPIDFDFLDLTSTFFIGAGLEREIGCDMKVSNLRIWDGGRTAKQLQDNMYKVILDGPHLIGSYYSREENSRNLFNNFNNLETNGISFFSEDKPF